MGPRFLYLLPILCGVSVHAHSMAKMLYDKLMRKSGYNRHIRPVITEDVQVKVNIGLTLAQIIDVVSQVSVYMLY